MSTQETAIHKLKRISGMNQPALARYIGVTQVCVHHWLNGKAKPKGANLTLIQFACNIGNISPELLQSTITLEPSTDPMRDIELFFNTDAGVFHWLGLTADQFISDDKLATLGRLAALMNIVSVLMPGLHAQFVQGYPVVVERARLAREAIVTEQDNRARTKRKRIASDKRHIRERIRERNS